MPHSDRLVRDNSDPGDEHQLPVDLSSSELGVVDSSPDLLRAALESCLNAAVPAAIWWGERFIQFENTAFRALLGNVAEPRPSGKPAIDASPYVWDAIGSTLRRVLRDGQPAVDNDQSVGFFRTGSATSVVASFVHTPILDSGGRVAGIFTVAVESAASSVDRRLSNASIHHNRADSRAALLQSVTAKLSGAATTSEVGQVIVSEGLAALRAIAGVVALRPATRMTVDIVASTGYAADQLERWEAFPLDTPSPMGDAVLYGRVVVLRSQAEAAIAYPHLAESFAQAGTEAWVAAPLEVRGQVLGALVFSFSEPQSFSTGDLEDIQTLASQCAQAIERAQLFDAERVARDRAEGIANRVARLQAVTAAMAEAATREGVAEAALRESIAAVGAAAGGLGVLDPSRQNLQRLAMLGYPPEIVEGTRNVPIDELGPIGDTAKTGEAIWLETNEQLFGRYPELGSIRARRSYGAAISVPLIAGGVVIGVLSLRFQEERPFSSDDRDLIYAIARGCAQALERSRLYDAEREARTQAEEAVRARDEFLSIASHELRTPVAALKGATQLMLRRRARGDRDEERLTRTLTVLNDTADRLAGLTGDLLDVSRLRTGHLTLTVVPSDVVAVVESVVQRSRDELDAHHNIVLEAPDDIPSVNLDPVRIEQVLSNLLDNAIKYSPAGGRIGISVQSDPTGVIVSIHDEGIGLPFDTTDSIFEPFGRAANAATSNLPGMGLGLYICRNIINLHGGWIRAASAGEGQGTTLSFWLPTSSAAED